MVSAASFGSASILPISWMYIAMMGRGLRKATQVAQLNANFIKAPGAALRRCTPAATAWWHECISTCARWRRPAASVPRMAKRLIDFGFHAPTLSFPVAGTLMVEPTESESLHELDRFINAMIQIREEISAIEDGRLDREDNPLKNAPHTATAVTASEWTRLPARTGCLRWPA